MAVSPQGDGTSFANLQDRTGGDGDWPRDAIELQAMGRWKMKKLAVQLFVLGMLLGAYVLPVLAEGGAGP